MNEIELNNALKYAEMQLTLSTNESKTRFFKTIVSALRAELSRQENAPLIKRERWIVLRDGTEVFCGLARQYHFKPISELGNTALKTYLSKNKAIAAFEDSWRTKFDNCRYTVEKITETYIREPKGEKE